MKKLENATTDHRLPDGTWVSIWAACDLNLSPWCFIWADFETPDAPDAWYRVFIEDSAQAAWRPMNNEDEVYKETGFDRDPAMLEDSDDAGTCRCAAEKLPKGRFQFQVKFTNSNREVVMDGGEFSVR